MEVVKIEWIDSCSSHQNWVLKEDLNDCDFEPIKIVSYGVIVHTTEDCITIAQNYGRNPEQCCNLMTIPKGCIIKRTLLEEICTTIKENN